MPHLRKLPRPAAGLVLPAALLAVLAATAPAAPAQEVKGRVVVLGFDGADHRLVSQMIAEGKLPNLAKLAREGSFSPLRPTIPAQTPVSWSTFSTGLSPGRTLIFDFLKRDPKTYRPEFAIVSEGKKGFLLGRGNKAGAAATGALLAFLLVFLIGRLILKRWKPAALVALGLALPAAFFSYRFGGLLPESLQTVVNHRQGTPFWEVAGKNGIKSVVLHVPVTFPAVDYDGGRLLSGLGVPDLRGRIGTPSYYTSDPFFAPKNKNEFSVELIRLESNVGTIRTEVFGPYNKLFPEPPVIKTPMTLTVLPDGGRLRIEPEGSDPVTIRPGEWSPWVTFTFAFNPVVKLTGIGRFHLARIAPEVELYLSPIHFNPLDLPPNVKITAPRGLAPKLAKRFGLYKTAGWSIDTWSMSEETIDEPTFLDDVTHTVQQYRKMMDGLLAEKDVRLYVQVYEFTDRVGHVMWRFLDPTHPMYDAEKAAKFGPSVERNYKQMDEIVGDAQKELGPEDLLVVLSDHGFSSWRRSINYNTWLARNGYLGMKGGEEKLADLEQLFSQGEFWPNVDWSRTKAYSMGLGEIYINLKGRESQGTVEPGAEYDAVRSAIKTGLMTLIDEATGRRPVERVYFREEAYPSFDPEIIPDIFVTNSEGYRVGWQATLGVVTPELYEENRQVWSGDHCSVDPDVVPGILFSSRPLRTTPRPGMADVPATIYKALGLTPPEPLDGAPLF